MERNEDCEPRLGFEADCLVCKDRKGQLAVTCFTNAHTAYASPPPPDSNPSLKDDILDRNSRKAYYREEELRRHLKELVEQMLPLQEHLNLHPSLIYFTSNGKLIACSKSRNALDSADIRAFWYFKSPKMQELLDGKHITDIEQDKQKSDVYSLGMIFFQMVTLGSLVDVRTFTSTRYSRELLSILQWMTRENECDRPNFTSLHCLLVSDDQFVPAITLSATSEKDTYPIDSDEQINCTITLTSNVCSVPRDIECIVDTNTSPEFLLIIQTELMKLIESLNARDRVKFNAFDLCSCFIVCSEENKPKLKQLISDLRSKTIPDWSAVFSHIEEAIAADHPPLHILIISSRLQGLNILERYGNVGIAVFEPHEQKEKWMDFSSRFRQEFGENKKDIWFESTLSTINLQPAHAQISNIRFQLSALGRTIHHSAEKTPDLILLTDLPFSSHVRFTLDQSLLPQEATPSTPVAIDIQCENSIFTINYQLLLRFAPSHAAKDLGELYQSNCEVVETALRHAEQASEPEEALTILEKADELIKAEDEFKEKAELLDQLQEAIKAIKQK